MWTTEDTKATAALLVGLGVLLMLLAIAAGAEPRAEPQRPIPPPAHVIAPPCSNCHSDQAPLDTELGELYTQAEVVRATFVAYRPTDGILDQVPGCGAEREGWSYYSAARREPCWCVPPFDGRWRTAAGELCPVAKP